MNCITNNNNMSDLEEKVRLGFKKTYSKLIEFKKMNNSPFIVSRNGKVVAIPWDEVLKSKMDDKI